MLLDQTQYKHAEPWFEEGEKRAKSITFCIYFVLVTARGCVHDRGCDPLASFLEAVNQCTVPSPGEGSGEEDTEQLFR